ncbi:MAG: hypothetical protein SGBAC_007668 [Bacillariaceae sp.]
MGRNWNKNESIAALHATYQQIVKENAAEYASARRKKIVIQRIAKLLKSKGIRFVRWNPHNASWEDAGAASVIKKVAAACRELKTPKGFNHRSPGKPKKAEGKKDVHDSLANDPSRSQDFIPTSTTTEITTRSGLPISSRRSSRVAAMAATVAIAQSNRSVIPERPMAASGKSTVPSQHQNMAGISTPARIQNDPYGSLLAHHSPEFSGTALRLFLDGCAFEPNPLPEHNFDPLKSTSSSPSQPITLSPCRKLGCNWIGPQQAPKTTSNKRSFEASSTNYPTRSKKARNEPERVTAETNSHTPATTTFLLPPEFQSPEPSACIKESLPTEAILAPIVSWDDNNITKTPVEKSQSVAKDFVTPEIDIPSLLSDIPGSPTGEIEHWWSGMRTDHSPFLTQSDSLFDNYPSVSCEPPSPLGLSALPLLSDSEENFEHSTLSNLSSSFSIPPCQFDRLEAFDSTSRSHDMDVLATPAKLQPEAKPQET